jgi:tryptophan synthase alpha chain
MTAVVLESVLADTRSAGRPALIGYLAAGYPSVTAGIDAFAALLDGGCDVVEVGMPFSDPVLDGPVIQNAQTSALAAGFRTSDLFATVEAIAARGGVPVVMTYFNPVLAHGVDAFARDLAAAGGAGMITPDLIVDEADEWRAAAAAHNLAPIFLVAPSSTTERIALTTSACRGFVYAASVMGVTGARESVNAGAADLVARCRAQTDLPIGVGLGVRTGAQAADIGSYADAVIVGSALVSALDRGLDAVRTLAGELADGVRASIRPAGDGRAQPAAEPAGRPASTRRVSG